MSTQELYRLLEDLRGYLERSAGDAKAQSVTPAQSTGGWVYGTDAERAYQRGQARAYTDAKERLAALLADITTVALMEPVP